MNDFSESAPPGNSGACSAAAKTGSGSGSFISSGIDGWRNAVSFCAGSEPRQKQSERKMKSFFMLISV